MANGEKVGHGTDCKCDYCWNHGLGWLATQPAPKPMTGRERAQRLAELDGSGPLGLLGKFCETA